MAKQWFKITAEDLEKFSVVGRSGEHLIFDCPYCPTYYGPNAKGFYPKLYYHPGKGVGYCFRCETAIILEGVFSFRWKRKLEEEKENDETDDFQEIRSLELFFQPPNDRSIQYLLQRSPYLERAIPEHLWTTTPREGVVFPIRIQRRTFGFQIRFLEGEPRYYTSPGPKLLWHPDGIDFSQSPERITLVEGIFGALGARYLGFPYPIAIFGHHLSNLQIRLLKHINPGAILVAMDEERLSRDVAEKLRQHFLFTPVYPFSLGDLDELAVKVFSSRTVRGEEKVYE